MTNEIIAAAKRLKHLQRHGGKQFIHSVYSGSTDEVRVALHKNW